MKLIKPFPGLRPQLKYLKEVIAPPYDIVSREQALKIAVNKPHNFLHISKPEIDLAADVDPHSDIAYQTATKNFQKLLKQKILRQDPQDCYYIYRLSENGHQQIGLAAAVSIEAYLKGRIKKHETTRMNKEVDRAKNIEALNAQASPVMLAYQQDDEIDHLFLSLCEQESIYKVKDNKSVEHEFWLINDSSLLDDISNQFNKITKFYIADGHHRIAAAAAVAQQRNAKNDDLANFFLGVIFPDDQLQILSYHRIFKDLNGLTPVQFLQSLKPVFNIKKNKKAVIPNRKGAFGLYIDHHWYSLNIKPTVQNDVETLEVELLRDYITKPIIDIQDPRTDTRVDFVGGRHCIKELESRVNSGEMAAAITLYPTSMKELMTVSDKGEILPPKSTWFEPKLADGLISYLLY